MVKIIEAQVQARLRTLGIPVNSMDKALVQNYEKGIAAGMRLAINFPQLEVERLQEQFTDILEQERQ